MSSALFVDVEADFHARVPVVLCRDKNWWAALSFNQFTKCKKSGGVSLLLTDLLRKHVHKQSTDPKLMFSSTVALSAKSVLVMRMPIKPQPIWLPCPPGSLSCCPWFWVCGAGLG